MPERPVSRPAFVALLAVYVVFRLYLATLMIPGVVTMIPNYTVMVNLGLLDSYTGLIVPAAFSAFGTFLLRQFMLTIPTSLDEAASIDGAGHWAIFTLVMAAPSRELRSTRRREFPSVCPYPASKGSAMNLA